MPSRFARTPFGLPYKLLIWGLGLAFWSLVIVIELKVLRGLWGDLFGLFRQRDGLAAAVFLLLLMVCAFLRRRSDAYAHLLAEDGLMVLFVLVFPTELTITLLGLAGVLESISQHAERLQRRLPMGDWLIVLGEIIFQGGVAAFIGLTGSTVEQAGHFSEWHLAPRFGLRELVVIPLIYLSIFTMRVSVSFLTLWTRGISLTLFLQDVRATQSVITFLAEFATVVLSIMIAVVYARLDFLPVVALGTVLVALVALLSKQAEAAARQQRTIAEMKILVGVGRALSNPAQTRRELLKTLYQEGRDLFRADSLAVYLFPEDDHRPQTLEWQSVTTARPKSERRGTNVPDFQQSGNWTANSSTGEQVALLPEMDALGLAEWCVQHKQALRLQDIEREAALYNYRWLTERLPYRSWMGVPLEAEKKVLGVISVASQQPQAFSEQDEEMLRALGQQLVGALEKARLYELATIDGLTGLLNARAVRARLAEVFAKTLADNGQMGVLMFDIDFFKKVNDTYGHEVGNEVLQYLSKLVRSKLRDTDIAGRYGGEEFIVILPQTPVKGALDVAERLRRHIAARPVPTTAGELPITASFGVAYLPMPGVTTPDKLVEVADQALYASKRNGRNRVTLASEPGVSESETSAPA
ncbi:sensor domain-containing diguanylate cyclase [Chloracidobacterium aggregatum]|uniref:diguanylate cyclase n=1 Tax=Chloracidobacterium sp. N TaxID=2821540 RepID=A0ABX8B485_9BACT|nr:sensor domain-containing diguanylate cyclase [Chloracidobacterium aggregatum]QUV85328.1 sensor domain-containing diguanylate cyclase [Chloracidobacterium sp. 2]QUV88272.1 sensor domain-containing diguanylate cyclase [Chloracidobacterium sp. S]QUV91191.1 sensor domain-containing diguanylate cyclase [Chloracidobacterium sp. A]QUV94376.1 sensor domain-containing diguanylate cyclase [Chloracidobacterium sp. N]